MQIKTYHKESTSKSVTQNINIKQIENSTFGIFYRVSSYVIYTVITEHGYPPRLINAFLELIANSFMDEAKCMLGSSNIVSRIENIEGSHYFVRFDRTIKQKKKQFDDPNQVRNIDRMKRSLEDVHEIMRQNMTLIDKRSEDLKNVQDKAYGINQEAKKFEKKSKDLVWHLWIKKNLVWIVLILGVIILYFLF